MNWPGDCVTARFGVNSRTLFAFYRDQNCCQFAKKFHASVPRDGVEFGSKASSGGIQQHVFIESGWWERKAGHGKTRKAIHFLKCSRSCFQSHHLHEVGCPKTSCIQTAVRMEPQHQTVQPKR